MSMNTKKFSEAINEVDDKYYVEAANYQPKRKENSWVKWGALAACLCLVVVGATVLMNGNQRQRLIFNEVTSIAYSAPLCGTSVSESISKEAAVEILDFDITSVMPPNLRTFDLKYSKILESENGTLIGISVEGYQDASVYQSPGIYIIITFGNQKPMDDYDYVQQEVVSNTINGIPISTGVVLEHTKTTDSGAVRTIPALYSVVIHGQNTHYYIESRGKLTEGEVEALVLGITEMLVK